MIILNEKEYAENCLRYGTVDEKPFKTISILAKYYYDLGYRKKKITDSLIDFMQKNYCRYDCNKALWDENIEKIAKNAGKYTLYEIDGVWITKAELDTIGEINNKVLERLAFTLLCLGKLSNMKNPNNIGWVNNDAKEVFSLARISCSVTNRYERLGELYQLSLLEFPKRIDNLSCRVTYINDDSENVLFVSDFRELGYEYLKYKGEDFIRCRECGILIHNNKAGNKKYCSECAAYTPQETKTIVCKDCKKEVIVSGSNKRTVRCSECQSEKDKERKRIWKYKKEHLDDE